MGKIIIDGVEYGGCVDTTNFTSSDVADADATSWTSVTPITNNEPNVSLFTKLSQIAKNVRWLYKKLTAVNDSQKFSAWTLLNSGTGSGSAITGTITDYDQYDEFMVIFRYTTYIIANYVFDKDYVQSNKIFVGSYYYSSSSNLFNTLGITGNAYNFGLAGGETTKGTFEIYGRKYA